ncbi:hypothetical protein ACFYXP_38130 [Streptomyces sp. NPDC002466]|uniref:hypothetical protein n=1 Tax=unclassified Streptomyces TaxID=2593676 RepID=UPI0035D841DC
MSGKHLISDDETQQIAEGFLAAAHWLGDHEWQRIVIGPNANYLRGFDGTVPADAELQEDQRWSWSVSFSDPAGTKRSLSHETVLEGLSRIVYGTASGTDAYRYMAIQQWFTEPSEARRQLKLSPVEHSLICQRALYDKTVYPTGEASLFGTELDLFEKQRPSVDQAAERSKTASE